MSRNTEEPVQILDRLFRLSGAQQEMNKLLGISPDLYCHPLVAALQSGKDFDLIPDDAGTNAIRLREQELDGALLTPLDYARESSDYLIVPNVAATSETASNAVVIHFRTGVRAVSRLAVNPGATGEIVLAKILLAEQFDIEPAIVPSVGSLETMLQKADAALLVGDAALRASNPPLDTIDLVEEWYTFTGLPYVHNLWCFRRDRLGSPFAEVLITARKQGVDGLWDIALDAQERLGSTAKELAEYLSGFTYELNRQSIESLREFFHYAYYHGAIPDIPEVNLFGEDNN